MELITVFLKFGRVRHRMLYAVRSRRVPARHDMRSEPIMCGCACYPVAVRLFTGIALPSHITENLERLIQRLRPAAKIGWSPVSNLHITTKFIGEWPEGRVAELAEALRPVANRRPPEISVEGIGWFPNPHSPRVLFAGLKADPALAATAEATDAVTAALGIPREQRAFHPHLTLARIRDTSIPLAPLRQAIAALPDQQWGRFEAASFALYLSKPGPRGSIYTQLAEFPFST
jgi:2'-5' RNA ligase